MNMLITIVAATIAASLIANGFKRHGRARFVFLAAAALVLVLAFWFELVRATSHVWS